MEETLELRLVNVAQKVADKYKNVLEQKYYNILCNAIHVCREYHMKGMNGWYVMYDVVLYDDGIWEYAECSMFDEEVQNMWILVTDILICNCYLGCISEQSSTPQDMEIQEENIPKFVDLLEENIKDKIDYDKLLEFWDEYMCY